MFRVVLYQDRQLVDPRIKDIFKIIDKYLSDKIGIHYRYIENYTKPVSCQIAIIWSIKKNSSNKTYYRQEICDFQKKNGQKVLCIERGFIDREFYYSIGFSNIVGWSNYCNSNKKLDHDRRDKLKLVYPGCKMNKEGAIVVCGQVFWDSQVQHIKNSNINNTTNNTNNKINGYSQWLVKTMDILTEIWKGPIIFREHPALKNTKKEVLQKYAPEWLLWKSQKGVSIPRLTFSDKDFKQDLSGCYGVIAFNSNSLCEAMIYGLPVCCFDNGSMVYSQSNHSIKKFIDKPYFPTKCEWKKLFNVISYSQWNMGEISRGIPFKHLGIF